MVGTVVAWFPAYGAPRFKGYRILPMCVVAVVSTFGHFPPLLEKPHLKATSQE